MLFRNRKDDLPFVFFLILPIPILFRKAMSLEQKESRNQANIRAVYDLTMGLLWTGAGVFFILQQYLGLDFDFDPLVAGIFGVACIGYGGFRIWRGYKSKKGR
jgi:NhaP-type Na+/H+ or K+/H+ antiporter